MPVGNRGWSVFRRSLTFVLLLFVAAGALLSGCGREGFFPAVVTKVVDGDTVYVEFNGREEKVRLIGVDTPETKHPEIRKEPFGEEASLYTKQKLLGRRVYLELDLQKRDRYGRLLAYVWLVLPDSFSEEEVREKMFNAHLLLEGYAQVMTVPPNVRYAEFFREFQEEARETGKGLWGLAGGQD
ncbi:MAG: Nuclease (SNase domain protein) [Thermoanaerobacterales bacterium 50_218]|nr:MAG: Nuclease (SNase domain protein) [Thermoanaerobacterales bacterium 50_218]HAA90521.1 nuclease [Peptococcaceae bacterium]